MTLDGSATVWYRGGILGLRALAWSTCIAILFTSCTAAVSKSPAAGSVPVNYRPSIDVASHCPQLRIAIINGVNFHFEVVSGFLHLMQPLGEHLHIFLSPYARTANFDGAYNLIRWTRGVLHRTDQNVSQLHMQADIAIVVSPDYELPTVATLLQAMRPCLTISMVHNADFQSMAQLLALAPRMQLLSLAPHVATALAARTQQEVEWMQPIYPVPQTPDCSQQPPDQLMGMCLRGFAMQGKFSNLRRNYSAIWQQIISRLDQINDPQVGKVFHMNVLGKGPDRLALPPELRPHVTVHRRLPYRAFYAVIAKNVALVPSLANPSYFTTKSSSTIMTSLQTGVPVIATKRLLEAFSFLTPDAVFLQDDGEEEIDVMLRVARMPAADIMKTRKALALLRERMNDRAWAMLNGYVTTVCKDISAGKCPLPAA